MNRKKYILLFLSIFVFLSVSGCSFPWQKKKVANNSNNTTSNQPNNEQKTVSENVSGGIKKFKDFDELRSFLVQHDKANQNNTYVSGPSNSLVDVAATKESSHVSKNYSTTNIQVEGVDEADIVKTDGNYVYLLDYNDLYIITTNPVASSSIITKITFKSRPQEFYVQDNRLVVFGFDDKIFNDKTYQSFGRQSSYTYLKIFDISDPKNPKQTRDFDLEGDYTNSRLVGDYLYFITNNYQKYIENEPLLPRVLDNGQVLTEKCALSSKCYLPNVFYFDVPYESYNFTSVMAINIKNATEAPSGDVYLLSGNQNLYASTKNFYLTYTAYLNEADIEKDVTINLIKPRLSTEAQEKINKITEAASFILSEEEKKDKIFNLIKVYLNNLSIADQKLVQKEIDSLLTETLATRSREIEKTVIHKISFDGPKLEYLATGEVPGHVLNQFSMDENNNYFRIATTRSSIWSKLESGVRDSYNNVYVLDDKLQTVGMLEKLAIGEKIYSARFIGDRAYLVTYKQTDPLLTIDLKDPKAPRVLGELKIPGYSTYLHPYGDNLILGFGRDTETELNGNVISKGLKLGLFDVTNPSIPKELDSFVTGDKFSDSIALFDYKAFLASSDKNVISIPAVFRTGQYGSGVEFSGALVFKITDNKIKLRGRIDHSDSGNYTNQDYWNDISYYDNSVKRSFYINDALFTFSNKYLKISDLKSVGDNLSLIKTIDLLPKTGKDFKNNPIINPIASPTAVDRSINQTTKSESAIESSTSTLIN